MPRPKHRPVNQQAPSVYTRGVNQLQPLTLQPLDPIELSVTERLGRKMRYLTSPESKNATTLSIQERHHRVVLGRIAIGVIATLSLGITASAVKLTQNARAEIDRRVDCELFTYAMFANDPITATERLARDIHANPDTAEAIYEDFQSNDPVKLCGSSKYLAKQTAEAKAFLDSASTIAPVTHP